MLGLNLREIESVSTDSKEYTDNGDIVAKGAKFTVPAEAPFLVGCIEHRGSSTSVHLSEQNGMEGGDSSRAGPCPQGIRWRHREATDGQKANCGLRLETPKKCL